MEQIKNKYVSLCNARSDIYEHLPTLMKYATECETIFETGVRGVVSSWALVNGLINNESNVKEIILNDIDECNILELNQAVKDFNLSNEDKITMDYIWKSNLEIDTEDKEFDMVFIDTWHIYGQLKRELKKYAPITKKYIIMHDTTVDEWVGESIRMGRDIIKDSKDSNYPISEIVTGLWPAVVEFLDSNDEWKLKERYTNCNGLTILERVNQDIKS